MHELSLITSMIDMVRADATQKGIKKVKKVFIEVGEFSGALPHALEEAFSIAKDGTMLQDATLELRKIPAKARCKKCNNIYNPRESGWACPFCHAHDFTLEQGMELQVASYTAEE